MAKKRDIQWVTHDELKELVTHLATLNAALEVRLSACEAALPVDPQVKREADTFVRSQNAPRPALVL